MTKHQIAVLARLVYMAHWVLLKRFPSAQVHFHMDEKSGSLLLNVDVAKNEDNGERAVNPEPGMRSAINGILAAIGITTDTFNSRGIWISQGGISSVSTNNHHTHTYWLSVVSGGFPKIISLLNASLPEIPPCQRAPIISMD